MLRDAKGPELNLAFMRMHRYDGCLVKKAAHSSVAAVTFALVNSCS